MNEPAQFWRTLLKFVGLFLGVLLLYLIGILIVIACAAYMLKWILSA